MHHGPVFLHFIAQGSCRGGLWIGCCHSGLLTGMATALLIEGENDFGWLWNLCVIRPGQIIRRDAGRGQPPAGPSSQPATVAGHSFV